MKKRTKTTAKRTKKRRALTPEQIEEVRAEYARGARTRDLAERFDVCTSTVENHVEPRRLLDVVAMLREENRALRAALELAGVA